MKFYARAGKIAFGSYLRRLGEMMLQWASQVYDTYNVQLEVRWFPVFQAIIWNGGSTVTELADYVGHTHAAVSQTLKEMAAAKVVTLKKHPADKRQTRIQLTAKGRKEQEKMVEMLADVEAVMTTVFAECSTNPLAALQDYERAMQRMNYAERMTAIRKERTAAAVEIVECKRGKSRTKTQEFTEQIEAFGRLNYTWIERYFTVEEADREKLDDPERSILRSGGTILLAKLNSEYVGALALVKMSEGTVELAKMAVADAAQGKHVGWRLGQAAIAKAREMHMERVYLESNTKLTPAINLYYKLGFTRLPDFTSPYERANIAMELWL
jgi:DNA-binding MarR family transcriptional regulator/GNAT superfamily N-acetyltransferase